MAASDDVKATILVVEDDPAMLIAFQEVLEGAGYEVVVAANGKDALSWLQSQTPDLILSDISMPVMDGFKATAEIRKKEASTGEHIPIIAMTAHAMKGDREKCLDAGMDDYTTKPLNPAEVFQKIDDAMRNTKKQQSL